MGIAVIGLKSLGYRHRALQVHITQFDTRLLIERAQPLQEHLLQAIGSNNIAIIVDARSALHSYFQAIGDCSDYVFRRQSQPKLLTRVPTRSVHITTSKDCNTSINYCQL